MTDKKIGGAAFPSDYASPDRGMTLRDWFAGQALAGMLAFPGPVNGNRDKSKTVCAVASYQYADAMIAERDK